MKIEDYNEYYIQGSDHYLIPKDVFKELFNEMINWKEESNKKKEVINRAIEYTEEHRIKNPYHYEYNCFMANARASDLLEILKEVE